jgi:hypothetical protein
MTKKPKSPAFARWRISLLKGTPAQFLGYVEAPDEKAAIEAAAKENKIVQALRRGSSPGASHDALPFAAPARTITM